MTGCPRRVAGVFPCLSGAMDYRHVVQPGRKNVAVLDGYVVTVVRLLNGGDLGERSPCLGGPEAERPPLSGDRDTGVTVGAGHNVQRFAIVEHDKNSAVGRLDHAAATELGVDTLTDAEHTTLPGECWPVLPA